MGRIEEYKVMKSPKRGFLKKIGALSVAAFLAATPGPQAALADQTGPYISAAYGGYKSRGGDFDDENDLYELDAGFRFIPFLGVQVGYTNFGSFGSDLLSAEVDGVSVSGVGFLPVSESFTITGEVGQLFSTVEVEGLGFSDDTHSDTPFFGLGLHFRIAHPLWVTAEYKRYKIEINEDSWVESFDIDGEDTDLDTLTIGATLAF